MLRYEDKVPFTNIVVGAFGQAIVRSIISVVFYLVGGVVGLVLSWFYGMSVGSRSVLVAYPKASTQITALATAIHAAVLSWSYFGLKLNPYPFWWPV